MSDEDDIIDFPSAPRRRGRPRVPAGMPPLESLKGADREILATWMRERFEEIDKANLERIELLRTVGEHPSPIFQRIVRYEGALGMPRSLVAKTLGMNLYSLLLHYGADYDAGAAEILRSIAANALRIASSPTHPDAARVAIQVLDRRGGEEWKPPAQKPEEKSEEGAPLIDSSKLTPEERVQLRAMLERIVEGQAEALQAPVSGEG